jgi:hypothetical protein
MAKKSKGNDESIYQAAIDRAISYYCKGLSLDELAAKMEVSPDRIREWAADPYWIQKVFDYRLELKTQAALLYQTTRNTALKVVIDLLEGGATGIVDRRVLASLASRILYSRVSEFEAIDTSEQIADFTESELDRRVKLLYGIDPGEDESAIDVESRP